MPFCLYSNSACDWSVCCTRRQGLVTGSISIYRDEDSKFSESVRKNRIHAVYELTPARFPNQRAFEIASSGEVQVKKELKGGRTYD